MRKIIILFVLISAIFMSRVIIANDILYLKFGINADYLINSHSLNFSTLPNVPSNFTGSFSDANEGGINFGIFGEYLINKNLGFQLRTGFSMMNLTLSEEEYIGPVEIDGQIIKIYSEYHAETELSTLTIEPLIVFKPFDAGLNIMAGFQYGMFIKKDYKQYEVLNSEAKNLGASFADTAGNEYSRIRDYSGTIDNISARMAIKTGISYDFQLSKEFSITPELTYAFNFNNLLSDDDWKINSLAMGLSLSYSLYKPDIQKQLELEKLNQKRIADSIAETNRIAEIIRKKKEKDSIDAINRENEIIKKVPEPDADRIFIIIHSDKDEQKVNEIRDYLISRGLSGLKIGKWQNPNNYDDIRYRIISEDYPSFRAAYKAKKKISKIIIDMMEKFSIIEKPIIQSE